MMASPLPAFAGTMKVAFLLFSSQVLPYTSGVLIWTPCPCVQTWSSFAVLSNQTCTPATPSALWWKESGKETPAAPGKRQRPFGIGVSEFWLFKECLRSRARTLHLTRGGIQPTWGLTSVCQSGSHVRLFTTPWTVARQASLSMEFSGQEYWKRLPFASPGDLPDTGIKPGSSALQTDSSPSEPRGKLLADRSTP